MGKIGSTFPLSSLVTSIPVSPPPLDWFTECGGIDKRTIEKFRRKPTNSVGDPSSTPGSWITCKLNANVVSHWYFLQSSKPRSANVCHWCPRSPWFHQEHDYWYLSQDWSQRLVHFRCWWWIQKPVSGKGTVQTNEPALLAYTLGVKQLIVSIRWTLSMEWKNVTKEICGEMQSSWRLVTRLNKSPWSLVRMARW